MTHPGASHGDPPDGERPDRGDKPLGGLPLRDRLPDYLAIFGAGLGVAVVVGVVIGGLSRYGVAGSVGYTIIALGILALLAGGATGGGYTNLGMGALGTMFGGRAAGPGDDIDDPRVRRGARRSADRSDHRTESQTGSQTERLRKGLRPEANPGAFWQVVGGFAYLVIGGALVQLLG